MNNTILSRKQLRNHVRVLRNTLTLTEQQTFAEQLNLALQQRLTTLFNKSTKKPNATSIKLAIYLHNDGEINTTPFIEWCWQQNIQLFLPVIHPFSQGNLLFLQYLPTTKMIINQYGIKEPQLNIQTLCLLKDLDIIFTPLVAFDTFGNRLGMGGGFYDRTLKSVNSCKTSIIGLAHNCQQVTELPTEVWDIPLPEIITPQQQFIF